MVSERFSDHDFTRLLKEDRDFDKRLAVIAEIANEVEQKLMQIDQDLTMNECMARGALEWITMNTQRSQLKILSEFVLNAFQDGSSITIDLDNPRLLTAIELPSDDFYHELNEESQEAFSAGERKGTDMFSEIITPSVFDDPQIRSIYFLPWAKNLFQISYCPEELQDGSIWQPLQTRLPGAEIIFYYPPDSSRPERLLHLSATQPSSPQ